MIKFNGQQLTMEEIETINDFKIFRLSKTLATKYLNEILAALDLIPEVDKHTPDDILQQKNDSRIFHAKWDHSLIVLHKNGGFAGIIMGYEREKEKNNQYPQNSIYINGLSITQEFQNQGIGKFLIKTWIDWNKKKGFLVLDGPLRFSVQTNKEKWNIHVQNLYESFGFKKIGEKKYGNRIDNVYILDL